MGRTLHNCLGGNILSFTMPTLFFNFVDEKAILALLHLYPVIAVVA